MRTFKFLINNPPLTPAQWNNIIVPDDIMGPTSRVVYKYGYQAAMRREPMSTNPNLHTEYCYVWNRGWIDHQLQFNLPVFNDTI